MTPDEFFDVSWDLNKKGVITNGGSNLSILYNVEVFQFPARFNYYPDFKDNQLFYVPARVSYNNWSPWNKEYWSDKLILEVKTLLEDWMGGEFTLEKDETGKNYFTRIQGRQKTTIKTVDDQYVKVEIRHDDYPK